jgi:nucleoside-diphosphate-sugar epimerase
MKVLVTGASGFLGREVVRAAAAAGHDVIALIRPTAATNELGWPDSVRILRGDLRQLGDWSKQLGNIDAVAHLAAVPTGDLATQFSGTVVATENLVNNLPMRSLRRFVHVSSFAVYDCTTMGGTLTEVTPIESSPERRDAYTTTKIIQERLVTAACKAEHTHLVVIRPGAIIGPGKDWDFGRVLKVGRFDLVFSPGVTFPITYVDNCADAIVKALEAPVARGSVYNIVDDDLPSYDRYHRLGRRFGADGLGPPLYVPWFGVSLIGSAVALVNRIAFNGRAKVPELLDWRRQRVRWGPRAYSNRAAKLELGWSPAVPLETAAFRIIELERGASRTPGTSRAA